uniref:CUB domain-containing protein n=1 Tax=Trichogramma kaykai TaxID=54128 RepID=A0ABD2X5V8_9HYME
MVSSKNDNLSCRFSESSIHKYCNSELKVPAGEGGFLQSPGYPSLLSRQNQLRLKLAQPGQRIVLTFRDFSIRDGSCSDVLRVHDSGNTLYESCGTKAGVEVVSDTNVVTINFRALSMLYPKRGFFYILGCPDVRAPPGSRLSDVSLRTTFRCRAGALFPDSGQQARTIRCSPELGRWIEDVDELPACVALPRVYKLVGALSTRDNEFFAARGTKNIPKRDEVSPSSGLISRDSNEPPTSYRGSSRLAAEQSSIVSAASIGHASRDNNNDSSSGLNLLEQLTRDRIGSQDNNVAVDRTANFSIAEQTHRAMMKEESNTVLDVILPTILMGALFVVNAIIVYIIFRYRKRNSTKDTEELALQPTTTTTSAVQANGGGDSCCPV